MLHVDLNGAMETTSISGAKYGLPIVDDCEGYIVGFTLKRKSDAEKSIMDTIEWYRTQFGIRVKCLRADKGGEFVSKMFKSWCQDRGIEMQFTHTGESKENGVAERTHRSLMNSVRILLEESGLSQKFWAEAYATAVKNQNSVKHKRTGRIPHLEVYGTYPDWDQFRPFGCLVTYLDRKSGKLGKRGRKGIMVGYNPSNTKGYRVLDMETGKIIYSGNVKFFESTFPMSLSVTNLQLEFSKDLEIEDKYQDEYDSDDDSVQGSQVTTLPVAQVNPPMQNQQQSSARPPRHSNQGKHVQQHENCEQEQKCHVY